MKSPRYQDKFPNPYEYAVHLVPTIIQVIGKVDSVVDVGGGIGAWCKAFKESGATRVLCIDTPEIEPSELLINANEFHSCDLTTTFPAPIRCDLAICLEVAEHIPCSQSQRLVRFLTHSSDIVVFSASIPGQPGLGHINEQPSVFWKRQFREFGFNQWDVIRPRIVFESDIPYWYRQNMFIYADQNWRDHLNA
ncbi:MAG: class I SAM-dependent methyltransferase, partial [Nitrososphaera sp.]|nr:class I SAM-dependent methyltransferase [Nitrososphaera sp.]